MSVSQCGLVLPFGGECRERAQDSNESAPQQVQTAPHENQVRVVRDVGTRRAEMYERLCRGCGVTESVKVGHHVVTEASFVCSDRVEIDTVESSAHLLDRCVG